MNAATIVDGAHGRGAAHSPLGAQAPCDAKCSGGAEGQLLGGVHMTRDTQRRCGAVETLVAGGGHWPSDVQEPGAVVGYDLDTHAGFMRLRGMAEVFFSAQESRIRIANKAGRKADGAETAWRASVLDEANLIPVIKGMEAAEAAAQKALLATYRSVVSESIREWQKATPGIGEHTLARLLGRIGHPRVAVVGHWVEGEAHKRVVAFDPPVPRTVGRLWSFAGHGDPTRQPRRTGITAAELAACGSDTAKMLVHLMAESAMKQPDRRWTAGAGGHWKLSPPTPNVDATPSYPAVSAGDVLDAHAPDDTQTTRGVDDQTSGPLTPSVAAVPNDPAASGDRAVWPYRLIYEQARDRYVARLHADECRRCGPEGRPARQGTPWSDAHQLAAALRLVGKEILRDLWKAAADVCA